MCRSVLDRVTFHATRDQHEASAAGMTSTGRLPRPVGALLGLAVATLSWLPPAVAQEPPPGPAGADPLDGFDAYVAEAVAEWEVPGLSVAVVRDGRIVFAEGYGTRELGTEAPVDTATLFAIGSTTKAMTAAALGMLVDEGKLGWDDPVVEHLPWFRLGDPYLTAEVTVRDLLTHRAGLGNADFLWYGQDPEAATEDLVRALRHLEPSYSLRSDFIYQNLMYAAAGEVVEATSGTSWNDFVRTRIFEALGMRRSVTTLEETAELPNVARPHDRVDGEVVVIENASVSPVDAAGSVWSSAADMSRWLAFLLRGCETEGGEALLAPETCEELFTPQTVVRSEVYPTARLVGPHWSTYGLAWFQQDYEGRKVDFHTGSIDGMVAIAGLLRDEGLGVYVLANRDHAELRHALMYRVFDLHDPDPPRDWSAEVKGLYDSLAVAQESARAAREAERVAGTEPSLELEAYTGTYSDRLYGTLEVTLDEDADALRLRYGRMAGRLEHWHFDTFRVHWDRAWRGNRLVQFRLGEDGEVERVQMGSGELRRQREEAGRGPR